jgi:hypothetical protein
LKRTISNILGTTTSFHREIIATMETVFGRHQAEIRSVSGIYGSAYESDNEFAAIRGEVEAFAREEGRRPRMLVAKMGQDVHNSGAKIIATAFADLGFDVDIGPLFQTPEEVAPQDYPALEAAGVAAIFGPGRIYQARHGMCWSLCGRRGGVIVFRTHLGKKAIAPGRWTRQTPSPAPATACRFKPDLRHHRLSTSMRLTKVVRPRCRDIFCTSCPIHRGIVHYVQFSRGARLSRAFATEA